jgi:RNA polymerase sigma-70 factor (ECF subfamily)
MPRVNWPAVKSQRRRPVCRKRFRSAAMAFIKLQRLESGNFAPAAKGSKDATVSASTQAELPEVTDADVVRLAQQGDADAFERIYRTHNRKVYTLCLRMVGDRTDAEDLTQEVFLQLFRKLHQFRGESAFSTWLHRMSVNIVLMRFRKKNLAEQSLETITNPEDGSSAASKEFGGPDLRLNGAVDRITLETAINELPPGYKAMFILHDVQGYNHDEIAGIFGCTAGNSKSQVHKARARLRELLQARVANGAVRQIKSDSRSPAMDRPKYAFTSASHELATAFSGSAT